MAVPVKQDWTQTTEGRRFMSRLAKQRARTPKGHDQIVAARAVAARAHRQRPKEGTGYGFINGVHWTQTPAGRAQLSKQARNRTNKGWSRERRAGYSLTIEARQRARAQAKIEAAQQGLEWNNTLNKRFERAWNRGEYANGTTQTAIVRAPDNGHDRGATVTESTAHTGIDQGKLLWCAGYVTARIEGLAERFQVSGPELTRELLDLLYYQTSRRILRTKHPVPEMR